MKHRLARAAAISLLAVLCGVSFWPQAHATEHDEAWEAARALVAHVSNESSCEIEAMSISPHTLDGSKVYFVGVRTYGDKAECEKAIAVIAERGQKSSLMFLADRRRRTKNRSPKSYDLIHEAARPE